MTGRRLIFANGLSIESAEAGQSGQSLWLWIPDYTIQQASKIAFDKKATERIAFQYGDMEDVYMGYTVCTNISQDNNRATICMVKG